MTDKQINAAIHDALGNPIGCPRCSDPGCSYNQGLNYCADLNAMHEAEKVLNQDNLYIMALHIEGLCGRGEFYFRATARQRAEAFLRTLGKWEEILK